MGLQEDRAHLLAANDALGEALAVAVAMANSLETAMQHMTAAAADFDNVELTETTGLIALTTQNAEDVTRQIAQSQQNLEWYIGRMS